MVCIYRVTIKHQLILYISKGPLEFGEPCHPMEARPISGPMPVQISQRPVNNEILQEPVDDEELALYSQTRG